MFPSFCIDFSNREDGPNLKVQGFTPGGAQGTCSVRGLNEFRFMPAMHLSPCTISLVLLL